MKKFIAFAVFILFSYLSGASGPGDLPYNILGEAKYSDGMLADGANVTVTNLNTSESIYDIVGVDGNSGYAGWYLVNLADLQNGYEDGDIIKIFIRGVGNHSNWIGVNYTIVNTSEAVSQMVNVILHPPDSIPPSTIESIGTPKHENFVNINTSIWLNATDDENGVGVSYTHYEIWWDSNDDGTVDTILENSTVYDDSDKDLNTEIGEISVLINFSHEGLHKIKWYSADLLGNIEELKEASHYVDDSKPFSHINQIPYLQNNIPFMINSSYNDTGCNGGAGVKEVMLYFRYSYDNATWSSWMLYAKSKDGKWLFHAPYAPAYYEFYSIAVDNVGNIEAHNGIEAMAYVPLKTFTFELKEGWNLFTIPCVNDYKASTLLENISGCSIFLGWNTSSQRFDVYVPGCPYDFAIEDGKGYFVAVEYPTFFALLDEPIENIHVNLSVGWNILGCCKSSYNASYIYGSIPYCTILLTWNTSIGNFNVYATGAPYDFVVRRGEGFIVAVSEQSIWQE